MSIRRSASPEFKGHHEKLPKDPRFGDGGDAVSGQLNRSRLAEAASVAARTS